MLTSCYEVPREAVDDSLINLLRLENLRAASIDTNMACEALLLYRGSGRVSFANALLWAEARTERLPLHTMGRHFPSEEITVLAH